MKKLIPLSIVGILVLSGLGAVAQPYTEKTLEKVMKEKINPMIDMRLPVMTGAIPVR